MIDLNFNKHSLIIFNEKECDYICEKCNSIIWYQDKYSKYHKPHRFYEHYLMKTANGWLDTYITCNELIIKNILE